MKISKDAPGQLLRGAPNIVSDSKEKKKVLVNQFKGDSKFLGLQGHDSTISFCSSTGLLVIQLLVGPEPNPRNQRAYSTLLLGSTPPLGACLPCGPWEGSVPAQFGLSPSLLQQGEGSGEKQLVCLQNAVGLCGCVHNRHNAQTGQGGRHLRSDGGCFMTSLRSYLGN